MALQLVGYRLGSGHPGCAGDSMGVQQVETLLYRKVPDGVQGGVTGMQTLSVVTMAAGTTAAATAA